MKIYLSPSTQEKNIGTGKYGSEEQRMNELCDLVEADLVKQSFHVKRNRPDMTLHEVVYDSNAWKPDIHVALHSNAGGGSGVETWHYPSAKGEKLAKCIHTQLAKVIPFPDRGLKKSTSLFELHSTVAPACIIEVIFHDNKKEAPWLISNMEPVAVAITKGICDYFNIQYQSDKKVVKLDTPVTAVDAGGQSVIVGQLRPILEALGAFVYYDAGEMTVIGRDKILKLQVGGRDMTMIE